MKELVGVDNSLGIYISVPFCRAKCTYCNFASGVFGMERMDAYVKRICAEMQGAHERVVGLGPLRGLGAVEFPKQVDSIYLGGGTPSLLNAEQVRRLFATLRNEFEVSSNAEITLECAPGQLSEETLQAMLAAGVNRVSFGVQSFVDDEAAAVGRLHTRTMCLDEIERMRTAGVGNLNVDLIVGLPRQTRESWQESIEIAMASDVPHVSVYMLEVDEDSRLGREVLMHGAKYGADKTPSEDETAEWYAEACERLNAAGIRQYEISNFARIGFESRHNIRYWQRGPYLGFGLDAHSMLRAGECGVRWANGDDLDGYLGTSDREPGTSERQSAGVLNVVSAGNRRFEPEWIAREQAFEEAMFLGLRMNAGIDLDALRAEFGEELVVDAMAAIVEIEEVGLIEREDTRLRLTQNGRMVSNEVFSRLLVAEPVREAM